MTHSCTDEEASQPPPAINQKQHHRYAPSSSILLITNSIGMALNGYIAGATGFLLLLLLKIYGATVMNEDVQAAFTYIFLAAYVVGEIGFGLLIDHIGRKKGLIIVASLILLGSIGSTSSNGMTPDQVVWLLIGFRVLIGVAQGGEYPCCAVSTTELTSHIKTKRRGMVIVGTNYLMVALGFIIAPLVTVILAAIFKDNLEPIWRLLVGLPIMPTAFILYCRIIHIPNEQTKRPNVEKGNSKTKSSTWIFFRHYWFRVMIPTSLWMSYNFIFYPASVFSTLILDKVSDNASIISTCSWNILIFGFYLIGQSIACLAADTLGRRWTAMLGLFGQALIAFIVGGCYQQLISSYFPLFVFLYGALLGCGEAWGMMPSICLTEYTPRDYRGTVYGIGSGFAKAAGLVGVVTHAYMTKQFGIDGEFIIFGIIASLSGVTVLLFLQETAYPGVMEKADEEFEYYLNRHGANHKSMGLPLGVQQQ